MGNGGDSSDGGDGGNGFSGRIYVVTGGTQGIGAATAIALAQKGAGGIVTCGRNEDGGAATKSAIEGEGTPCEFVRADLGSVEDCRQVIAACDQRFGRIDGLVNAAGMTDRGTLESTTPELWDRMFAVNTRAPFLLMQDAIGLMRRDSVEGAIVNIGTLSGYGGQPFITAYCASKAALATLTKNVAYSVRFDRIRVNQLNIGWTNTPNERKARVGMGYPEDWLADAEAKQPFGRLLSVEDVARATLFLLGSDSGIMTGALVDHAQIVMGAWE
ncbi:MAG: SDR family oxidoreductase [Rhodospirillales bacterium]|nr:SDR family oxidoreductase [Rhodospirillales bacterium]